MKDTYHVLPVNDLKPHIESRACKCEPSVREDGRLIIHNAYDGREFFEQEEAVTCQPKKTSTPTI